jgi:hypothetical protein
MNEADTLNADQRPFGRDKVATTTLSLLRTFLTLLPDVEPVYFHGAFRT